MNSRDIEIYLERYNNRLKEFGYDAKTLGWGGGKNKQFERFKALTEIGIQEGDSVLDFGCGFADYFEYFFVTTLSDGREIELIPNGQNISVTLENRKLFIEKTMEARFNENKFQMDAVKEGFYQVVPPSIGSILQWNDLELNVCGRPEIDIDFFMKNVRYNVRSFCLDFRELPLLELH